MTSGCVRVLHFTYLLMIEHGRAGDVGEMLMGHERRVTIVQRTVITDTRIVTVGSVDGHSTGRLSVVFSRRMVSRTVQHFLLVID